MFVHHKRVKSVKCCLVYITERKTDKTLPAYIIDMHSLDYGNVNINCRISVYL